MGEGFRQVVDGVVDGGEVWGKMLRGEVGCFGGKVVGLGVGIALGISISCQFSATQPNG